MLALSPIAPAWLVFTFTNTSLGPENYTRSSLCIFPTFCPTNLASQNFLESEFFSLSGLPLLCSGLVSPWPAQL